MQQNRTTNIYLGLFITFLFAALLIMSVIPIQAQDGSFTTNTPVADVQQDDNDDTTDNPAIFATNTPAGTMPDDEMVTTGPTAPLFNYGMRFWLEADFVQLVLDHVLLLEADDIEAQAAANVLLYEMEQRFLSAPSNPEQRRQLIEAMINAPVGSLDMRQILRPFIQETLDNNSGEFLIEAEGFTLSLTPANLDGIGDLDRVIEVIYQSDDELRYKEYLLATANDTGSYTLLSTNYDLAAVPFGDINDVTIEFLRDVNADTLDELVLRVDDAQVSDRFYIIEHRNGRAVDLVDPNAQLRVGEIINWSLDAVTADAPDLTVFEYRAESVYPDWICTSQKEYTWVYERNLYRQTQDLNAQFTNIDSLGCTLANADLFNLPIPDATTAIESALLEYGFDAPSSNRALMTLAMFYVFTGRLDDARNTAQSVITVGDDTTWESQQANALIRASNASGNTALDICEAVAIANEFPACDMNAVIGRFLEILTLSTDMDLIEQLNAAGLTVLDSVIVSEIGRVDRTVILFSYFDSGLWGFYDGGDGIYLVEASDAALGFEEATFPQALIEAPQSAYDALLLDDDPARVLSIIDNLILNNPDVPLAPSTLYLQALAYELTGDRDSARPIYYAIWEQYSTRVWGQMAAEHLELR